MVDILGPNGMKARKGGVQPIVQPKPHGINYEQFIEMLGQLDVPQPRVFHRHQLHLHILNDAAFEEALLAMQMIQAVLPLLTKEQVDQLREKGFEFHVKEDKLSDSEAGDDSSEQDKHEGDDTEPPIL